LGVGGSAAGGNLHHSITPSLRSSPAIHNQVATIKFSHLLLYSGGLLLPYGLTCLLLWLCGAFPQFWFWTVSYAFTYLKSGSSLFSSDVLRTSLEIVIGPALLLWLAPIGGAIMLWWEELLDVNRRTFLALLLVCSLCAVGIGFYYRGHYFIPLLPAMSLLTGIGVSRSLRLLKKDRTIELFLALPLLGLFGIGMLAAIIGNAGLWFATRPDDAVREIYGSTLFTEARSVGKYLRDNSRATDRIAVIGSEPEIYFYAHRRSATGYIYAYPLMERQAYATRMQDEMIHEIETNKPEYVVFVDDKFSWLPKEESDRKILDWWQNYWPAQFDIVSTTTIEGRKRGEKIGDSGSTVAGNESTARSILSPAEPGHLLLFKRR
jgi:hypothetical protein